MKKIMTFCIAMVAGMALGAPAMAAHKYGAAGCGLGSLVIGDKPGIAQVGAAILNNIGLQTLSITTGLSNCDKDGSKNGTAMIENFVAINRASIERDTAAGGGEYLSSVALLMGCVQGSEKSFGEVAQAKHDSIFTPSADAGDVVANFRTVIASDSTLVQACKL